MPDTKGSNGAEYIPINSNEEEFNTDLDRSTALGEIDEEVAKENHSRFVKLQVLKALYFIQTGAGAGLIKYLPVYFRKQEGQTEALIGFLLVSGQITNFGGGLFWGRLADLSGTYKSIMLATNLISIGSVWILSFKNVINQTIYLFPAFIFWSFFCSCWGTLVDAVAVIDGGKDYGKLRLWAAVGWGTMALGTGWLISHFNDNYNIIFITFSVGMFLSSVILFLFFKNPEPKKGKQIRSSKRLKKNDVDVENSCNADYDVDTHEDVNEPLMEALLLSNELQQNQQEDEEQRREVQSSFDSRQNKSSSSVSSVNEKTTRIENVLYDKEVILFLFSLFLQGVFVAFVESFLYVYLGVVYNTPAFFLGLCTLMATLWEVPVFMYASTIIRKLGIISVLTIAQWLYILRVVAYTYIPVGDITIDYWFSSDNSRYSFNIPGYYIFLVLEPLHAFVFAAMWSAAVEYSRLIAPSDCQGQMQAVVRGVYYFIGNGCGSILGGQLIDYYGYHFMYRFGAIGMTIWSLTWHILMNTCVPDKILKQKMKEIRENYAKEKELKK